MSDDNDSQQYADYVKGLRAVSIDKMTGNDGTRGGRIDMDAVRDFAIADLWLRFNDASQPKEDDSQKPTPPAPSPTR